MLRLILCAVICFGFSLPAQASDYPALMPLLEELNSSYAKVQDYTAVFYKQERVEGNLKDLEKMHLKFQKPFKVYLKWMQSGLKEALYVEGAYSNKVLARCDGLLGFATWSFYPRDPRLMEGNRHPITDVGFGFILEMLTRDIPRAVQSGEISQVKLTEETFEGRPVKRLELRFANVAERGYYAPHLVCHIDKEYLLPIGIACFDERGDLLERYGYKDLKVNPGLSDMDFSKANKSYKF